MTARRLFLLALTALLLCCGPDGALADEQVATAPTSATTSAPAPGAIAIAAEPKEDDPGITERGYFVFALAAGKEATGSVRLRNPGAVPVTIELAAVDAETAQTGGVAYAAAESKPLATGAWLQLRESRLTLAPGADATVEFTIQTPRSAAPGQHLAGIVASVPAEAAPGAGQSAKAQSAITTRTRSALPVQIDVPGKWAPAMTITGVSAINRPSGTALGIALRNNGATFVQPAGTITLRDAGDAAILSEQIRLGAFVPGTGITYALPWPGVPEPGRYRVEVELAYGEDAVARYRGEVTITNAATVPLAASEPEPAVNPAPEPAPAPAPSSPWLLYVLGALLGPIAALLVLGRHRLGRRGFGW